MTEGTASGVTFWRNTYEKHGPSLLAFLVSRIGDRDGAEDLLQETFVRAIRADRTLRDRENVRPYLFRIAHNQLINFVRKRWRDSAASLDEGAQLLNDGLHDSGSLSPEAVTEYNELQEIVEKAMEAMTPAHRQAFQLGVIESRPYAEIGRITGWTLSQVKINIYRARRKAIEILDRNGVQIGQRS